MAFDDITRDRPAVYESASIHVYPHHDGQYFSGESVLLEELIGTVVSHAVSHGAVSFLGAFGPLTATDPTPAAQQQTWPRFFALIETTGVDIAAARA